jgi:hypothetical protein
MLPGGYHKRNRFFGSAEMTVGSRKGDSHPATEPAEMISFQHMGRCSTNQRLSHQYEYSASDR